LVDFNYPGEYTSLIPVTFYNDTFTEAGILLYRMFPEGYLVRYKFKTMLMPNKTYSIRDADSNSTKQVTGNEIELDLMPGQNSAIYFIKESGTK